MAYVDAANYNKVKSLSGYPVGTIIPWSGTEDTIPVGWKMCSGGFLNISSYPKLYDCIGNTYGGTAGSTFRLPDIAGKGIVDIFKGHYRFLQNTSSTYSGNHSMSGLPTAAWSPVTARTVGEDPYWVQIGEADNGNSGSGVGPPPPSTIDLVGIRSTGTPGLTATVTGLALTPGSTQTSYNIMPRKLGDGHIPVHTHNISSTGEVSHTQSTTQLAAYIPFYDQGGGCGQTQSNETNAKRTDGYRNRTTGNHYVPGGGRTNTNSEFAGTGFTGGDMLAHVGGQKNFQTSISAAYRTWASIGGHSHGSNTITVTSGLSVRSTNTYSDIISNGVVIDNTPGEDAGTINMTSTCPSLTMVFIIKAF